MRGELKPLLVCNAVLGFEKQLGDHVTRGLAIRCHELVQDTRSPGIEQHFQPPSTGRHHPLQSALGTDSGLIACPVTVG